MIKLKTRVLSVLLGGFIAALANIAHALPALQLGPTGYPPAPADWTYDNLSDTWFYAGSTGSTAQVSAYANATAEAGGVGAYAWDSTGTPQYAYLVVSSVPDLGSGAGDNFDITVIGATPLIPVSSGYGTPPIEDPNDIAPHDIFATYFEIYQFQFDGPVGTITNTEPPSTDTGAGYAKNFTITINSLINGVTGLHFDVFTTTGSGDSNSWVGQPADKKLVYAVGPFSHDAQWNPTPPIPNDAPAPGTLLLLGLGLAGLAHMQSGRRHRES